MTEPDRRHRVRRCADVVVVEQPASPGEEGAPFALPVSVEPPGGVPHAFAGQATLWDANGRFLAAFSRTHTSTAEAEYVAVAINARTRPEPPRGEPVAWQPIETAPKDGTTVLVARFNLALGWVLGSAHWRSETTGIATALMFNRPTRVVQGWISRGFSDPPGNLGLAAPSHWMPLPAPPAESGTEEERHG